MEELFNDLISSLFGLFLGIIGEIFLNVVLPMLGFAFVIGAIIGACFLLKNFYYAALHGSEKLKAKSKKSRFRHIKNSPLFLACLQKIADGDLNSLYVNSHMACFNYGQTIPQSSVLDFEKHGYDPIPAKYIDEYYNQLIDIASTFQNVVSIQKRKCSFAPAHYLVHNNYYNMEITDDYEIQIKYRIVNGSNFKSFNIK